MVEPSCDLNPFADGTALAALLSLPSFEEALSRLVYLTEQGRPCGIVRGPSGSGKTPLLGSVIRELRRAGQECGTLDLRRTSVREFPWQIACELGTAPARADHHACWRLIEDGIHGRALAGRVTVLVLDHLGEPGSDLLPQLKRLLATAETSEGWFTVLAAARFGAAELDHFIQEHSELRIELGRLSVDEVRVFLYRVVEMTGCRPFSDNAIEELHDFSRGVFKDLMTLSRLAIIAQSAEDTSCITGEIVRLVTAEVIPQPRKSTPVDQGQLMRAVD